MAQNFFNINRSLGHLIILFLFNNIISSNVLWSYKRCKKYLDEKLDLVCIKYTEKYIGNNTRICDKWIANNLFTLTNIPDECQNKKYNLNRLVDVDVHEQIKIILPFYLNRKFISILRKKSLYNITKSNNEIEECFKILEKHFTIFNKNKKKYIMSNFCIDILHKLLNNFNHFRKNDNSNIEQMDINIYYRYEKFKRNLKSQNNNNIKNNNSKDETVIKNNNPKEQKTEEGKSYFNIINKDEDNELENYYINSRKDCVEYGLKSFNEDIIICTKYE